MMVEEVRLEDLPHYGDLSPEEREIIAVLHAESHLPGWRGHCFSLGYLWFDNDREAEALAEIGLALAPCLQRPAAGVVSELLMGFAVAREDRKNNEWGERWRKRV